MNAQESRTRPLPPRAVVCSKGMGINALHIVRSLGRSGIPVTVVVDGLHNIASRSRYVDEVVNLNNDSSKLKNVLVSVARHNPSRCVLYVDNDSMLWQLADVVDQLAPYYLFSVPLNCMRTLLDKRAQHESAVAAGIPVPKTFWPNCMRALRDAIEDLSFPIVVKPSPIAFKEQSAPFKVYKPDDVLALNAFLETRRLPPSKIMLQEFVHGGDEEIWFCLAYRSRNAGRAIFVEGRKLRQSGTGSGGVMAVGVTEKNADVRDLTERLLASLNYNGLCGVEFKFCANNKKYMFIELSARTERFHGVAQRAGVDFPVIAFSDLVFSRLLPQDDKLRKAMWVDIRTSARSLRSSGRRFSFCKQFLACFPSRVQFASFALDDLGPVWRS
jgi:D-aspartate ligase